MSPPVPPLVEELVAAYLALADAEAPGLVAGLYLTGSVALDDFRPERSDVDFVAFTAAPIEPARLPTLERIHAQLAARTARPLFEGIYLTWDDLRRAPGGIGPVPYVHERRFHSAGTFECSPVTWAILARHAVVMRGPPPAVLVIRNDPADLDRWTRRNLREYWRPWHARASRLPSMPGLSSLRAQAAEWGVLGVSRLHYTLATGRIVSKHGAGLYALRRFAPRWHPPIIEALRIRRGDAAPRVYRTALGRRSDVLAYVGMVIDDALALPPRAP